MKNYINLGKTLLGSRVRYVYLDTEEYLLRSLLVRHAIHAKVKGVMGRENEEYCLVSVSVLKKDEPRFLQAMEELKGKMLLFGHPDYETHGGELIEKTWQVIRNEAADTGRVVIPTGGIVRAKAIPEV